MAYPNYPAHHPSPQAPKKSGNRGCWIALGVVAGLALLALIAVGIGIYAIAQNKDVRKIASAVGEGMEIMKEAQRAPGTAELRKLGCDQAMVLDVQRLAKLASRFADAGSQLPPDMPGKFVLCAMASAGGAPSCATVAKTYLGAVPTPAKRFAVSVEVKSKEQPECSEVYAPDGKHLGDFDRSSAPPVPTESPQRVD